MLVCPRCQRANPPEAAFCHFDGAELRPVPGRDDAQRQSRLPHEFVFPSGRRCRTYDDLVQGCQAEWEVARDLLRQGAFRQFLAGAGRMDLARAAQEPNGQADADIALETFLAKLPATATNGPRLDLNPRRLILGTLHVGDTRQLRVTVTNQGQGLLHGTLAVAEGGTWLQLGGSTVNGECLIKTPHEQEVLLRIDTRGLAAPHKYSAKLTVITNGGIVEVPVRLDVAVYPFPKPPFQGVSSPREMAEKMRTQPKPAVSLLESGEVARWFETNGWTYPVQGPAAHGVAAVQQFFEGMGLSKPPPVRLSEAELRLSCLRGEPVRGQLTLRTDAKKWVYGRAESDAPWLRLSTPSVSGPQQAVIAYEADTRNLQPGRVHDAVIKIEANAGQTFTVPVHLDVRRSPAPPPRPAGRARPVLLGALAGVGLRLLLALPGDLYARVLTAESGMPGGSFAGWAQSPLAHGDWMAHFVRHFVLATFWIGAVVSVAVLWRRGSRWTDRLCGLLAGAAGGLAVSASFACVLPSLDLLPRLLWQVLGDLLGGTATTGLPWLWTTAWIIVAAVCWGGLGALAGLLLERLRPLPMPEFVSGLAASLERTRGLLPRSPEARG
jgi:hypothetical protein